MKVAHVRIYKVNADGTIVNSETGRVLTPYKTVNGTYTISYSTGNYPEKRGTMSIARFVYQAFHGELPRHTLVKHKDGNRGNNSLSNLYLHDTSKSTWKTDNFDKLTLEELKEKHKRAKRKLMKLQQIIEDRELMNNGK